MLRNWNPAYVCPAKFDRGSDTNPIFGYSEFLEVNGSQLDLGSTSRIDLVDWDGDGMLDLLAGEYKAMSGSIARWVRCR